MLYRSALCLLVIKLQGRDSSAALYGTHGLYRQSPAAAFALQIVFMRVIKPVATVLKCEAPSASGLVGSCWLSWVFGTAVGSW